MQTLSDFDPLLDQNQVAEMLGLSVWTLGMWRRKKVARGPRFVLLGFRKV